MKLPLVVQSRTYLLRFIGLTLVYALLAKMVLTVSSNNDHITIFWMPGGVALAALSQWGKLFAPAVFLGAFIAGVQVGDSLPLSSLIALGNTLETLFAAWLLGRLTKFDKSLETIDSFIRIAWVAAASALISALIGPLSLYAYGFIKTDNLIHGLIHWWQADLLGILMGTPLLLVWRQWPSDWFQSQRFIKTLGFFFLTFAAGQIIFLNWFNQYLNLVAKGYWMFLFIVWAAVHYGRRGALFLITLTALQALTGALYHIGYFANDIAETELENFWFFMLVFTVVGVALAINIETRKQKELELLDSEARFRLFLNHNPIAAWIKDQTGRHIYVNQTFDNRFGMQIKDWLNKTDFEVWPERVARQFHANDLKIFSAWKPEQMIDETLDGQGNTICWSTVKFPFRDSAGNAFIGGIAIDITERKRAEDKLRLSEQRLRKNEQRLSAILRSSSECVMLVSKDGVLLSINPAGLKMIEAEQAETVINRCLYPVIAQEHRQAFQEFNLKVCVGEPGTLEYEIVGLQGARRWIEAHAVPFATEKNEATSQLAFAQDITERKEIQTKLNLAASVFTHAREGILLTDADANILDVNESFTRITGYGREEVLGKNPRILQTANQSRDFYDGMWTSLRKKGHWYGELWNRRKNGEIYAELLTISAIRDASGKVRNYVGLFSDITSIKQHQQQLEHIAHFDPLTNLPNRLLLADRLQQAMTQNQRRGQTMAVCYIDLDGFKEVNDKYGHNNGDELLIEVSQRMRDVLRDGDTLSRIGGDEFIAVLADLNQPESYTAILDRLLDAASDAVEISGIRMRVSASIGVTLYPEDGVDADQLMRHADQAMYRAKQLGKNRYYFFDPKADVLLKVQNIQRLRIEQGLSANEFELFYQPKIFLHSQEIAGVEALIRWRHPEQGLLAPDQFLSYIENTPLENLFGQWVIENALTQMERWIQNDLNLNISINISVNHLQSAEFLETLKRELARHPDAPPTQLRIEILETAALTDFQTVSRIIKECAEIGVSFALDDFGTGYSSLSYLRRLPADTLKIDLSFVRDMLIDKEDRAIVKGVIVLARTFNRITVAEGVETAEHLEMLRDMGCDIGQGYGIARPMPAADLPAWCARHAAAGKSPPPGMEAGAGHVATAIRWVDRYEIGHERIDFEHRIFLGLISEIDKEVHGRCDHRRIRRLLNELKEYARFHFVSEENIMEDIAYPELESHRLLHQRLLANLAEIQYDKSAKSEDYGGLTHFLHDWFAAHTTTEDKKIALFIDAQNQA